MCIYCGNINKSHFSEVHNASELLNSAVLGTNQELANYLTSGFWNDSSTLPRKFNLKSTGVNAKNGLLTYNTWSIFDIDGINDERKILVDESLNYWKNFWHRFSKDN